MNLMIIIGILTIAGPVVQTMIIGPLERHMARNTANEIIIFICWAYVWIMPIVGGIALIRYGVAAG